MRYKGPMLLGTFFLLLANVFLVWGPVLVRVAIDEVEQIVKANSGSYSTVWEALLSGDAGAMLAEQSLWLTLSVIAYGVLLFLTRQTIIVASRKIEFDMRNEVYDHIQQLPASFFASSKASDIYVRATEDIVRVREYFGPAFMYMVNTITRAGILIAMMFWVNPELTLWALAPLPVLAYAAWWMSEFIHKRSTLIQEQFSVLSGRAQEAFSAIRTIKAYGREAYENDRFVKESGLYRKKKLSRDLVDALFFPMLNLMVGFSIVLVVWQGGLMVISGTTSVGNIAEFIIDVLYLTWPVASLGYTVNLIQRAAASQARIAELMSIPVHKDVQMPPSDGVFRLNGALAFKNVTFTYPGSEIPAVSNISMEIPGNSTAAIVGKTGCGKSTLVNLITRLYEPDSGSITLDGRPISEIPLALYRKRIGIVPQDTFLFSDSIRENIGFGTDDATSEQITEAARKAQVLENIMSFEKKFETQLGERGITLSGGQKQRTSIARALIREPDLLILDDSLSAVDTNTESAILKEIREVMQRTTSIIISHRLSTVKYADTIFVMENGEIKESGSHETLLAAQGLYHTMYQKQLLEKELLES